jgi:hypothetical protein
MMNSNVSGKVRFREGDHRAGPVPRIREYYVRMKRRALLNSHLHA